MNPSSNLPGAAWLLLAGGIASAFDGGALLEAGTAGVRDDLLVPLVFSGPRLGLGGFAGWEGFGARHEARARLGLTYETNRYGHEAGTIDDELSWLLDWPVFAPTAGPLRLGTGLASRNHLSYLGSWDDAHGYWIASISVPATIRQELSFGGWDGSVRLSVAALVLESRTPGGDLPKQHALGDPWFGFGRRFADPEPTAPWNHLDLQLETWWKPAGGAWEFGATTGFVRASEPRQAFVLDASLRVARRWGGSR